MRNVTKRQLKPKLNIASFEGMREKPTGITGSNSEISMCRCLKGVCYENG